MNMFVFLQKLKPIDRCLKKSNAIYYGLAKGGKMKAVTWHGRHDIRVDNVEDPKIQDPKDAIIKITSTAICGSDLHLYNGVMSGMKAGDIIGHEPMGIVEEVGSEVKNLKKGDRVVVPFTISCGNCFFCHQDLYSLCDESNPKKENAIKMMGHSMAAFFGYSHIMGGIPGGQAEYLRVPFANVGPIVVPDHLDDDKLLFLSDIFPTGWMAAENCDIQPTDVVAVWGCGPVGLFAIKSAQLQGAKRVIAIDDVPERLKMAEEKCGVETIDFAEQDVYQVLQDMTFGYGPDKCIDAVGAEAHSAQFFVDAKDSMRQAVRMPNNRPYVLNEMIKSCRKGGTLSIPGAYTDNIKDFAMGPAMNKALTFKTGQTHVQKFLPDLLDLVKEDKIDLSFLITHKVSLAEAPAAYEMFNEKIDNCVKVVLVP